MGIDMYKSLNIVTLEGFPRCRSPVQHSDCSGSGLKYVLC